MKSLSRVWFHYCLYATVSLMSFQSPLFACNICWHSTTPLLPPSHFQPTPIDYVKTMAEGGLMVLSHVSGLEQSEFLLIDVELEGWHL